MITNLTPQEYMDSTKRYRIYWNGADISVEYGENEEEALESFLQEIVIEEVTEEDEDY